jgi:hypothetical protein
MNTQINIPGIEVVSIGDGRMVNLICHWNVRCCDLTRDEFVKQMRTDLETALDRYLQLNGEMRKGELLFDFKPDVSPCLPDVCILVPDNVSDRQLGMCFDEVSKSRWWMKADGWTLSYKCGEHHYRMRGRGTIELLMNEQDTAECKAAQKRLEDAAYQSYCTALYGRY